MRNKFLMLVLGSSLSCLWGGEIAVKEEKASKAWEVEVAPFVFLHPFHPGYGLSVRATSFRHMVELAPMNSPEVRGHFGSRETIGLFCSYSYTFFQKNSFELYGGYTFLYQRAPHYYSVNIFDGVKTWSYEELYQESYFLPLIGMQYKLKQQSHMHVFVDLALFPRVGAGFHF